MAFAGIPKGYRLVNEFKEATGAEWGDGWVYVVGSQVCVCVRVCCLLNMFSLPVCVDSVCVGACLFVSYCCLSSVVCLICVWVRFLFVCE